MQEGNARNVITENQMVYEITQLYQIRQIDSTPCYFSPLAEISGSIELLENSLTYEGVQWRKIIECLLVFLFK